MSLRHILPSLLLLLGLPLQAEDKETTALSVSGIFGNRMVLQQKTQAPIWGWGTAGAVIAGDIVQVQSPKIPHPVAVRYGWKNADCRNLMNQEGLPASSLRTDHWADGSKSAESKKPAR